MSDAFIKSLKWCLLMVFAIGGVYGFSEAGRLEDARYIMISVLSFGAVYMLFQTWSELPGKIMVYSLCIVLGLGVLAQDQYAPFLLYYYTDFDVTEMMGFFRVWTALVVSVGLFLMMLVFYKFDNDGY